MIFDALELNKNPGTPLFMQIVNCAVAAIREQKTHAGDPLPSIRELSRRLGVSKITIENAYAKLVLNGFIVASPKKGFAVASLPQSAKRREPSLRSRDTDYRYNFSDNTVDMEMFPFLEWRKSIGKASRNAENMTSYSEPQGLQALREAIARNIYAHRGVICSADQILVGAGLQTLLSVLITLIEDHVDPGISFENAPNAHASWVFRKWGWTVDSFDIDDLSNLSSELLYIGSTAKGNTSVLTPEEKRNLLAWLSESKRRWIIEDDYLAEFRSSHNYSQSLQTLNPGGNIVYYGSFSRTLSPALRVGFMVLPEKLMEFFRQEERYVVQSSSVLEQLALADFIMTGGLSRQIKRLKKHYANKARLLSDEMEREMGGEFEQLDATSLTALNLLYRKDAPIEAIKRNLEKAGLHVPYFSEKTRILRLGFTGLSIASIPEAVKALKESFSASNL